MIKNDNDKDNSNNKNNFDEEKENAKEIINKNTFNYKGKEISGNPKPSRRSITSYDLNKYNMKSKQKKIHLLILKIQFPKKKIPTL